MSRKPWKPSQNVKDLRKLGFWGKKPRSRWILGRICARRAFAAGENFSVNVYPVNSRYVGPARFMVKSSKASARTLYRINVKPKGKEKCT